MSEKDNDKSLDANWSTQLAYVTWFKNAIDYLETEDCASGDLVIEARKKIGETIELITTAIEGHDKEKQDKVKDLINEIKHTFFMMLDNCYNKYAGSRVS